MLGAREAMRGCVVVAGVDGGGLPQEEKRSVASSRGRRTNHEGGDVKMFFMGGLNNVVSITDWR
jgi:hypothetical protein